MKPLYLPTDELVVHQINDDNPTAKISLEKVTLSKPKAVDKTGTDGKKRNTEFVVTARKGKGFRDSVPVTSNRLDMGAMFRNTNVFLDVHNPKSSTDLLAALNRGYGLALVEKDIVPAAIADGGCADAAAGPHAGCRDAVSAVAVVVCAGHCDIAVLRLLRHLGLAGWHPPGFPARLQLQCQLRCA